VTPPAAPQLENTANVMKPAGSAAIKQAPPRIILRVRIEKPHSKNESIVTGSQWQSPSVSVVLISFSTFSIFT
jgi:hypothetical protein